MTESASQIRRSRASRKVGRHRIRNTIERMILDGRFRPGEKLIQSQLAKKFDVSQGMIREALFELKEHGLVETSDNRGMFVRSLDARSIYEMLVIREVFDGVAARECCGRMPVEDGMRLRKMADDIFDLTMAGRHKEKVALDRQFHLEIVRLTDNRILAMYAHQHHILGKVAGSTMTVPAEETRRGHYAILTAILAGDRNQAEQAARAHVRNAWPPLEAALAAGAGGFVWLPEDKRS